MLLRSISKHVKDQNWFAVVLDFFIVVVGILIAFRITSWNEGRLEHQLSQDYTTQLISDLQDDLVAAKSSYNYYSQVLESITDADRLLSQSSSDATTLIVTMYRASEYTHRPLNRATWEQIVSSGHLNLLPNTAVRNDISEYYKFQETKTANRIFDAPYRSAVRSVIPLPVQLSIREGCSDVFGANNVISGFKSSCDLNVERPVLEATAEQLKSSANLHEKLRDHYSLIAFAQLGHEGDINMIESVIENLSQAGRN